MTPENTSAPVVQVRRRVTARPDEIFDLWTKPEWMVQWMSPFPGVVHCKATCDLRPGGAYTLFMSTEGASREVSGTYVRVERPRLLVFTWTGALTNNTETLVTVEFISRGEETELVLTHERLPTSAMHTGHTKGWGNILDHLAEAISKRLKS